MADASKSVSFNPAARLEEILRRAAEGDNQVRAFQGWMRGLGWNSEDPGRQYFCLARISALIEEIAVGLVECQDPDWDPDVFTGMLATLRSLTKDNLAINASWAQVQSTLNTANVGSLLKVAKGTLTKARAEARLPEDEIQALAALVARLRKELTKSALPEDLVRVLLEYAALMEDSLLSYRARGAAGLTEALTFAAGTFALHIERLREFQDAPEVQTAGTFLKRLWGACNVAVPMLTKSLMLYLESRMRDFLGLPPGTEK